MSNASTIINISELIEAKLGLHFPENRLEDLRKLILSALPEMGYGKNIEEFYHAISSDSINQTQYDILALHLTIGETYFFRELLSLQALKNVILPALIEERSKTNREIRIWSAGCCSGEEAYTMAIILKELLPDIDSWNITIIGTDINRNFIQKAIIGRYTQWSFRVTQLEVLNRYFVKVGNEFEIIPRIRKMVTFSHLNLADDNFPSRSTNTDSMDIILCRNVLMYFSSKQRANVIHRFTKSLKPNGWLITSPVEVSNETIPGLARVNIGEAILYHKGLWREEIKISPPVCLTGFDIPDKIDAKPEAFLIKQDESINHQVAPKDTLKNKESYGISTHKKLMPETVIAEITDLQKAEKCFKQGLYHDALLLFKKAHHLNPGDNRSIYFIAKTSANLGFHADARAWCEKLIARDIMNANYQYLLSTILLELNETSQAEQILKKVLYLDSQHVLAHFVMGNYMRSQGKTKIARKHYQNILDLLEAMNDDLIIPDSEDLTVGRMKEMVSLFR